MRPLDTLIEEYVTKVAAFSHANQIKTLQEAGKSLSIAAGKDPALNTYVDALVNKINSLYNIVNTKGITAALSAKFRNEFMQRVNDLELHLNTKEYNPYENNVFTAIEKPLTDIQNILNNWVPTGIDAPKQFNFPETEIISEPRTEVKNDIQVPSLSQEKFELPQSQEELESWPKTSSLALRFRGKYES